MRFFYPGLKRTHRPRCRAALGRVEVLAVLGMLSLIGCLTLHAAARNSHADSRACWNNLRQLAGALSSYSQDNDGTFPARSLPRWPEKLRLHYTSVIILRCPSDGPNPATFGGSAADSADAAPRSYVFNGWNDYYRGFPPNGSALPESAILEPAQTVVFGEKDTASGHFWFDYWAADDNSELEQGRHLKTTGGVGAGASNYAFADGSVRLLKWGASLSPLNLWAITPEGRHPTNPQ